MRMIIAGASLAIIDAISSILRDAILDPSDDLDTSGVLSVEQLYSEALACIVGKPSDMAFQGVFRRGVDSPVAAIERVVASVVEYTKAVGSQAPAKAEGPPLQETAKEEISPPIEPPSLRESSEGWDVELDLDLDDVGVKKGSETGEGWEVDVDVDIDDIHVGSEKSLEAHTAVGGPPVTIESIVKRKLTEIAESPDIYGSGIAMDVVSVLGKVCWRFATIDQHEHSFPRNLPVVCDGGKGGPKASTSKANGPGQGGLGH